MLVLPDGMKPARGVEPIFERLQLDRDRVIFLKRRAYGGPGNRLRHAVVDDDSDDSIRRHAIRLLLALGIWLETFSDESPMPLITESLEGRGSVLV